MVTQYNSLRDKYLDIGTYWKEVSQGDEDYFWLDLVLTEITEAFFPGFHHLFPFGFEVCENSPGAQDEGLKHDLPSSSSSTPPAPEGEGLSLIACSCMSDPQQIGENDCEMT